MTPDRHETLRLMLPDLAEGSLSPGDRRDVEDHLAACSDCRASFDALVLALGLLEGLPAVEAPPDLSAKVRSRIRKRGGPRRRRIAMEQRIETTSVAAVLVAAFLLVGARLLVPMPEVLDASGPVEATAEANGAEVTVLRVPVSRPAAVHRLLAAAEEAGAVDASGRPFVAPPPRAPIRPGVHDLRVPAEALPRLRPEGAALAGEPGDSPDELVPVRLVVE